MPTVSEIYTKDERLEQALDAVAEIEPDFEDALHKAADAEAEYEIQYAKAFLEAEGTEKARESTAKIRIERFLRDRYRSRAVKEFIREKLKDRQAAVSARQSLLSAEVKTNQRF